MSDGCIEYVAGAAAEAVLIAFFQVGSEKERRKVGSSASIPSCWKGSKSPAAAAVVANEEEEEEGEEERPLPVPVPFA